MSEQFLIIQKQTYNLRANYLGINSMFNFHYLSCLSELSVKEIDLDRAYFGNFKNQLEKYDQNKTILILKQAKLSIGF